ncbi:phosphotransferase family protein [Alicyclobacillus ferrooxydans]|uniref:Aminoglycoside phosphotransferase domain-containing protein n=1 Tax=Alicyclobacillus ferrooxydans TaxID=471514 RepID=A0A0N8PNS3_9BACL|nr:phosphotransferase [Alicyclobacillus ferrooxydans]KPV42325.1 hypothetical protein AN477_18700 [Alicyclobacillus ferrooxydans]
MNHWRGTADAVSMKFMKVERMEGLEMNETTQPTKVAKVLRTLFSDLEMPYISLLGEGWDSVAYLVNESIVVRVPKRSAVGRQMAREVRILGAIRPYVSARIPLIEWFGQSQEDFAVSAIGYRKLSGTPLWAIPPGPTRDGVLRQVGQFLRDLHAIPISGLNKVHVKWFRWTGYNV